MSGTLDEENMSVDTHESVKDWEAEVVNETTQNLYETEVDVVKKVAKKEWDKLRIDLSVAVPLSVVDWKADEAKKATETQPKATQATETQPKATQATEAQSTATQATEAQSTATQAAETQPKATQATEAQSTTTQEAESEAPLPESNEWKYNEMLSLMQWLSAELQSVWTGPVALTWEQMKKLNRITLLRAPFFWAPMSRDQAREAWRDDIVTWEDLKNKKTIREARRRLRREAKAEKSYRKELDKLIAEEAKYLNEKNLTNRSLHITRWLWLLNERLEAWEYIDHTYALLPNVSPLVLNLCSKENQKALACWNRIQVMHNWRQIEVYPQSMVTSAWRAWEYFASCWTWYSNIFEKFLVENTKMTQWQASSMINMWLIAWALTAWYFLFTKKEWWERKFAFPSLWKLAWLIWIPILANYASQMTTWNSLLDNLSRLWRTWEFPWSSSESLPTSEQFASQQVMWQFVLLWVPKKAIKQYWTFTNWKLVKLNLWNYTNYLWLLENDQSISADLRTRYWMQRLAVERIMKDNWASIALNNYIASLWITKSELEADGDGVLDDRLSETRARYQKMLDYVSARWLEIDASKKDKVLDALKEKDVDDKLFDKLKEEWCFIPNPNDERYKEISKLNISNEKKIKICEAFKKLSDEWTKFGQIKLEVVNNQIQLTSWAEEHKILLNTDNTIDNLVNAWGTKLEFKSEEELLRMWLFINYLRSTWWKETPDAQHKKNPFVLSGGIKFWEDLQFMKPWENKDTVLSSMVPFFSEMASKFPTIEAKANREFLKDYLNKLWENEHPWI